MKAQREKLHWNYELFISFMKGGLCAIIFAALVIWNWIPEDFDDHNLRRMPRVELGKVLNDTHKAS